MNIPVYWAYIVPYCLLGIYQYIGHILCHSVYYEHTSILGIHCATLFIMNIPVYWAYIVNIVHYEYTSILGIYCAILFIGNIPVYWAYIVSYSLL